MATDPDPKAEPVDPALVEQMVKRSTKKSKVPARVRNLVTSHVVAQHLTGAKVEPPRDRKPKKPE